MDLGLDMDLEVGEEGFANEILGVGLEEVGSRVGSVKWLMIVEWVFALSSLEMGGVLRRGVSSKYVWLSWL